MTSVGFRGTTANLTTGRLVFGSDVATWENQFDHTEMSICEAAEVASLLFNDVPTKINSPLENSRLCPISARTNQALEIVKLFE